MAALKKSGLGRGLGSLFGDIEEAQKPVPVEKPKAAKPAPAKAQSNSKKMESAEPAATGDAVIYVKVADIKPNAAQPRKVFDEDALADLAASIKEHGLIQPVILRKAKKGYELVAGERRWRAAHLAGLKEIPAIVRELDEKTNALFALIENVQREDLNAIEEAEGIKAIIDQYDFTQEEASKVVGKSRSYVTNSLRLLDLPAEVRALVSDGKLSQGHAKAIAGLAGEELQKEVAEKAAKDGWSVRQIENYTKSKPKKRVQIYSKKVQKKDAETRELEDRLTEGLGTRVQVEGNAKRGKIIVEYYSADELDRIVENFCK